MKQQDIQGQMCIFLDEDYLTNRNITGGLLQEPVTLNIGEYTLTFETLYTFTESGAIYGGFLTEPHLINIGAPTNKIPVSSVFFYFDSQDIEFAKLAEDTSIKVGKEDYIFSQGEELFIHPNVMPMSGVLTQSSTVEIHGQKAVVYKIGFWETGIVSGIIPMENVQLQIEGKTYEFMGRRGNPDLCHYSISFSQDGQLNSGTLSNKETIDFPF